MISQCIDYNKERWRNLENHIGSVTSHSLYISENFTSRDWWKTTNDTTTFCLYYWLNILSDRFDYILLLYAVCWRALNNYRFRVWAGRDILSCHTCYDTETLFTWSRWNGLLVCNKSEVRSPILTRIPTDCYM